MSSRIEIITLNVLYSGATDDHQSTYYASALLYRHFSAFENPPSIFTDAFISLTDKQK
ncbi:hypothetical protein [Pedobacter sp. Leaf176]|uniref:hypothetical protein n=1 Tax=Pedobacter sp. Leaf176 TaxID=1736286 RepID=UPI0012FA4E7E|nr:hypothetical protein [Pedobacter sp. Leaf176]